MRTYPVASGEPAPWFDVATDINPRFAFDTVAGRYVVLSFLGSASDPYSDQLLKAIGRNQDRFTGVNACFFGVSHDPQDREENRVPQVDPGLRAFWDFDNRVASLFGLMTSPTELRRLSYVLDTRLRCILSFPFSGDPDQHVAAILQLLDKMPPVEAPSRAAVQAPILVVPRIFEPELCLRLIDVHQAGNRRDSGFMTDIGGKTTERHDHEFKKREDVVVEDEQLRAACMHRIHDRLTPEIKKAFQFTATRMERYLVSSYSAETRGHFNAHRDNTTKGTAHRRFAVSMNLNTGNYEGGYLRFPEFGSQVYEAPAGGAVVFSCSLLHEATTVTSGTRYAFLPFLYDDAAAKVREENLQFIAAAK
jgi:peroxiredoxin/predicted 2-oxoglutarate/Fe(II)-dependent dioxygenase YbiX